jgi:hypothetical protein
MPVRPSPSRISSAERKPVIQDRVVRRQKVRNRWWPLQQAHSAQSSNSRQSYPQQTLLPRTILTAVELAESCLQDGQIPIRRRHVSFGSSQANGTTNEVEIPCRIGM